MPYLPLRVSLSSMIETTDTWIIRSQLFVLKNKVTKLKSNLLIIVLSLLFWGPSKLMGQTIQQDSSYSIETIEVIASKLRQQVNGSVSQEWNSAQLDKLAAKNIGDLLLNEAGVFIKSYGQGSLATSSVRGGSAGHTLVLWNGLPIQSPMLGQLDLALLPIQIAESIQFTLGGNSAMWGSGAIGGVLNMENQADFSNKLSIKSDSRLGSFGQFQQQIEVGIGNERFQSVTKLSHRQADNDFYYFLAEGLPDRQQTNAELNQQFLAQDLYWKINNRNKLEVHFWWQTSDRNIPPTNVQNRSEAHLHDLNTRLILEYKHLEKNGFWNLKTGFFDEHIDYYDDLNLIESPTHFTTYLAELTRQWKWRKSEFIIGNTHTHTSASSIVGYRENTPTEYKKALFGSWRIRKKRWTSQFSLRQEMVGNTFVPIVPAFDFNWQIASTLFLKGKVSRNYRLPTFNDRFWMPGGNPDLLPESGWSQELTVNYQIKKQNFSVNTSLTAFNRNIDNWILWSGAAANNITKVWSRGLEPRIAVGRQFKNLKCQLRGGYDYILSTNQIAVEIPRMAAGDQLIYTPRHQAFSSFSVEFNKFYLSYQHTFTGLADGINDSLDRYHVGNVQVQCVSNFKQYTGNLFFNINNLWNADYLVVERQPMPGINFEVGLNLTFKK